MNSNATFENYQPYPSPSDHYQSDSNTFGDKMMNSYQEQEEPSLEPVKTLFIRGLPTDIRHREVHNLFRSSPGFVSASVNYLGGRKMPISFALFQTQTQALGAMEEFQGFNFDPESDSPIQIQLAKADSKPSKSVYYDSRGRSPAAPPMHPYYPPHPQQVASPYYRGNEFSRMEQIPNVSKTVFLGNLSPTLPDTELERIFGNFHGFENVNILRKEDHVLCFVDFSTIKHSSMAVNALQGMDLLAASSRPVRIEFAKGSKRRM